MRCRLERFMQGRNGIQLAGGKNTERGVLTSTHLTSLLSDFIMADRGGVAGGVLTSWYSQKGRIWSLSLSLTCMLQRKRLAKGV